MQRRGSDPFFLGNFFLGRKHKDVPGTVGLCGWR